MARYNTRGRADRRDRQEEEEEEEEGFRGFTRLDLNPLLPLLLSECLSRTLPPAPSILLLRVTPLPSSPAALQSRYLLSR